LLLLLLALVQVSTLSVSDWGISSFITKSATLTCLPPRLLEKPGGSGMLEAALVGRGSGEFIATTHCGGGGGGRAEDMFKECQ
jgi:hypothetical protein